MNSIDNNNRSQLTPTGFSIGILLLLTVFVAASIGIRHAEHQAERDSQYLLTLDSQLQALSALVRDAESGQRGFLITQNERYLEPYNKALTTIPSALETFSTMAGENVQLQQQIHTIESLIQQKLDELALTIRLAQNQGVKKAADVVNTHMGKNLMDKIHQEIKTIHTQQTANYSEARERLATTHQWRIVTEVITVVLFFLAITYFLKFHKTVGSLIEQKAHLDTILEAAPVGILTLDSSGIIESANRESSTIFGYKKDELIGQPLLDLIDGQPKSDISKEPKLKNFSLALEAMKQENSIIRTQTKIPLEIVLSEGNTPEWPNRFIAIIKDLTEHNKTYDLIKAQNIELQRFAYICSHDLQEPLRMISIYVDKLDQHLTEQLKNNDIAAHYFNYVKQGTERSRTLVNDLLQFSRLEYNADSMETVDTSSVISSIKALLPKTEDGDPAPYEIQCGSLPIISGYGSMLHQLFQNLIFNAIKYQSKQRPPKIQIEGHEKSTYWLFSISDNGIGISEKHYKKIFDLFKRLHHHSDYPGTGIGLSICKKIVELHGGRIWVESEVDIGSTFYFTIKKFALEEISDDNPISRNIVG